MFGFLKKIFGLDSDGDKWNSRVEAKEPAPYKVEPIAPITDTYQPAVAEPAKCGCGRSPTGFCVGLHKLSVEEWAVHADNPNKLKAVEKAPAKAKKERKPKAEKAKPVEPKVTKPRAARKPKA